LKINFAEWQLIELVKKYCSDEYEIYDVYDDEKARLIDEAYFDGLVSGKQIGFEDGFKECLKLLHLELDDD
jgi:hypothetical protein